MGTLSPVESGWGVLLPRDPMCASSQSVSKQGCSPKSPDVQSFYWGSVTHLPLTCSLLTAPLEARSDMDGMFRSPIINHIGWPVAKPRQTKTLLSGRTSEGLDITSQ